MVKNCPEHFIWSMQVENVKNASELHSRQLRFWTQRSRKCSQNFFCNLARRKLPRCVWTSQQTTSFLDTNILAFCLELFSVNLAGRERPKCVWTSQQTAPFCKVYKKVLDAFSRFFCPKVKLFAIGFRHILDVLCLQG